MRQTKEITCERNQDKTRGGGGARRLDREKGEMERLVEACGGWGRMAGGGRLFLLCEPG